MKGYDMGGRCLTGSGVRAFLGGLDCGSWLAVIDQNNGVGVSDLVDGDGVGSRWRVMVRVLVPYMAW